MRRTSILLAGAVALGGCWEATKRGAVGPDEAIRRKVTPELAAANSVAASRVDALGRAILAANPKIDARPMFQTVGTPEPEIFHNGTSRIVITQGLVDLCKTDAELGAVLCFELGKMVAEREALAPLSKKPAPLPPIDPGVQRDVVGFGTNDMFRYGELARLDRERKESEQGTYLPEPTELARGYLKRAGFAPEALERVKPHLRAAAANSTLERQLTPDGGAAFAPAIPR